ncbi:hypothetical protein CFOL_v3_22651 [Cephalotus follicularis]|uniref:Transmembrane protein n=1 Tax=Cephalotus follicularis TaxID=3775 RepID=A0A1Q3CFZ3_CEPFO|nr:hypothetical protein CFOL_v3_22651 [Cephalotus follicularis]
MEPINNPQQTLNQFSLKIATKLLLSISIFSIILSNPSFLPYIFQSPMQLFSYNIDKNYMFLLCNGILVLIIKNSGLVTNSQWQTHVSSRCDLKHGNIHRQVVESSQKTDSVAEENVFMEVDEAQDEVEEQVNEFLDEEGTDQLLSIEELNKKCEDFIRKMKTGIQIEAQ